NRVANAPTALSVDVPSFSELRMRFSEPMAVESFLQWETFRVAFAPDSQGEVLCDATLDVTQSVAIIRPYRFDQAAGTFEVVGWGKGSKNLQLILTTVPK